MTSWCTGSAPSPCGAGQCGVRKPDSASAARRSSSGRAAIRSASARTSARASSSASSRSMCTCRRTSVGGEVGQPGGVRARGADQRAQGDRAAQVELGVVLEGEADPAEHLDAVLGGRDGAVEADRPGDERGELLLGGLVGDGRGGVPRGRGHGLAGLEHLRAQVLDRLEGADLLAELLAHAGVLHRRVQAPPRDPRRLGGGQRDHEGAQPRRREVGHDGALDGGQVAEGRTTGQVGVGAGREVDALEGHEPHLVVHHDQGLGRARCVVDHGAVERQGDRAGELGEDDGGDRGTQERPRQQRGGARLDGDGEVGQRTAVGGDGEQPHLVDRRGDLGERRGGVVLCRPGSLDPAQRARPLPEGVSQLDVVVADPDRHDASSRPKLERVPIMPWLRFRA